MHGGGRVEVGIPGQHPGLVADGQARIALQRLAQGTVLGLLRRRADPGSLADGTALEAGEVRRVAPEAAVRRRGVPRPQARRGGLDGRHQARHRADEPPQVGEARPGGGAPCVELRRGGHQPRLQLGVTADTTLRTPTYGVVAGFEVAKVEDPHLMLRRGADQPPDRVERDEPRHEQVVRRGLRSRPGESDATAGLAGDVPVDRSVATEGEGEAVVARPGGSEPWPDPQRGACRAGQQPGPLVRVVPSTDGLQVGVEIVGRQDDLEGLRGGVSARASLDAEGGQGVDRGARMSAGQGGDGHARLGQSAPCRGEVAGRFVQEHRHAAGAPVGGEHPSPVQQVQRVVGDRPVVGAGQLVGGGGPGCPVREERAQVDEDLTLEELGVVVGEQEESFSVDRTRPETRPDPDHGVPVGEAGAVVADRLAHDVLASSWMRCTPMRSISACDSIAKSSMPTRRPTSRSRAVPEKMRPRGEPATSWTTLVDGEL
jgi:hypothetical protein